MTQYPIQTRMDNGASVADWLGTALTAAKVAVLNIEGVRAGEYGASALERAEHNLTQALEEVRAVRETVGL